MLETYPRELAGFPDAVDTPKMAQTMLAVAESYVIDGPDMFEAAGDELRNIVTKKREIEEMRLSITRPMDESKKRIMDFFRQPLDFLERAERTIKASMANFQREQQRIADEARRKAEEEQRKAREEAARIEAERRAAQEELEAAILSGDTQAMEQAQQRAADAAQPVEIEHPMLPITADMIAPTTPAVTTAKASGVSFKKKWVGEIVDKSAFIRAAHGRPELEAMLEINQGNLNKFAQATGGQAQVAGVVWREEMVTSARRK